MLGAGASLLQVILFSGLLAGGQYLSARVLPFGDSPAAERFAYWVVAIPYFIFLVVQAPSRLKRVWANAMVPGALEAHISERRNFQSCLAAAKEGEAAAQLLVGSYYAHGTGVPRNATQAAQWYRKAADQDDVRAQFSLGQAYAHGDGVPKDPTQAAHWYRKAAKRDDSEAQFNLGQAYANGEGVPKDASSAAHWYRESAVQGNSRGQVSLAEAYANGTGVAKDAVLAYAWLSLAAEQDTFDETLRHRDLLRPTLRLTPEQLAEAQRLSSSWEPGQSLAREPR